MVYRVISCFFCMLLNTPHNDFWLNYNGTKSKCDQNFQDQKSRGKKLCVPGLTIKQ